VIYARKDVSDFGVVYGGDLRDLKAVSQSFRKLKLSPKASATSSCLSKLQFKASKFTLPLKASGNSSCLSKLQQVHAAFQTQNPDKNRIKSHNRQYNKSPKSAVAFNMNETE
jgi:hypothetical protein